MLDRRRLRTPRQGLVAKAWSAAQLAFASDGRHVISLDRVIHTMKRTGEDMRREYKETSECGLAVRLASC